MALRHGMPGPRIEEPGFRGSHRGVQATRPRHVELDDLCTCENLLSQDGVRCKTPEAAHGPTPSRGDADPSTSGPAEVFGNRSSPDKTAKHPHTAWALDVAASEHPEPEIDDVSERRHRHTPRTVNTPSAVWTRRSTWTHAGNLDTQRDMDTPNAIWTHAARDGHIQREMVTSSATWPHPAQHGHAQRHMVTPSAIWTHLAQVSAQRRQAGTLS